MKISADFPFLRFIEEHFIIFFTPYFRNKKKIGQKIRLLNDFVRM